jgi:zinc/manganese transport system permease protein
LKYLLSGNILWVSWEQIVKTAALYAALGVVHYFFREKIFLVSSDPSQAARRGIRVRFWDLFFYVTFGLVITSSVQIGGVLLVFTFLIVPASASLLFFTGWRARLLFGWGLGVAVSALGVLISSGWDLPTGPAIIAMFGAAFMICLVGDALRPKNIRSS